LAWQEAHSKQAWDDYARNGDSRSREVPIRIPH
jgi:hypothetical protein